MSEHDSILNDDDLIDENKQLKLEIKKLNRRLNLVNDNMLKLKSVTSAKENLSAVIAAEKSAQEKQLQVIMENSMDIIILLDPKMTLLLSTRSFLNFSGLPGIGFFRKYTFGHIFRKFVQEDSVTHMQSLISKSLESNEIITYEEQLYHSSLHQVRDFSVSIIPFDFEGELDRKSVV